MSLHKHISEDDKKKHFRHELGLGDAYARDFVYSEKYRLKMKSALGTEEERAQARKSLKAMGEAKKESIGEYLKRIKSD